MSSDDFDIVIEAMLEAPYKKEEAQPGPSKATSEPPPAQEPPEEPKEPKKESGSSSSSRKRRSRSREHGHRSGKFWNFGKIWEFCRKFRNFAENLGIFWENLGKVQEFWG
ncbi:probable RNA-binding protein 23, partial [Malurus melanocephalus]|uniref:probable RNA-binding protein 23 n=1 Tax=Malurus melanocephalus TaxID=175006 RepID=UPI002546AA26